MTSQAPPPPATKPIWRLILVPVLICLAILILLVAARSGWFGDLERLAAVPGQFADTPWSLPVSIGVFMVGAFLGIPQFVLIAAAVFAFGPWTGFLWSWISTLCSGTLTFWTGRLVGAEAFQRLAGRRATSLSEFVGENAFFTSAVVRNVPAGPFVLVNMAFGVSHARWLPYLAGIAVGMVPKAAIIAFAGQGLLSALGGSLWLSLLAGAALILLWLAIGIGSRRYLRRKGQNSPTSGRNPVDKGGLPIK